MDSRFGRESSPHLSQHVLLYVEGFEDSLVRGRSEDKTDSVSLLKDYLNFEAMIAIVVKDIACLLHNIIQLFILDLQIHEYPPFLKDMKRVFTVETEIRSKRVLIDSNLRFLG